MQFNKLSLPTNFQPNRIEMFMTLNFKVKLSVSVFMCVCKSTRDLKPLNTELSTTLNFIFKVELGQPFHISQNTDPLLTVATGQLFAWVRVYGRSQDRLYPAASEKGFACLQPVAVEIKGVHVLQNAKGIRIICNMICEKTCEIMSILRNFCKIVTCRARSAGLGSWTCSIFTLHLRDKSCYRPI